jgi:hypothetical protein
VPISALADLDLQGLRMLWATRFGPAPKLRSVELLRLMLAWRLQEQALGRLTLNVLLSFAQFEREVTGERIRDKIAASKKKGLWMGGMVPLGYDLPDPGSRVLAVNLAEAGLVRTIFSRYADLGSVHALACELKEQGVRSKITTLSDGRTRGDVPFSRGALFHLLRNRLYIGQIPHKGASHPGQHQVIIARDMFDAVQARLDAQTRRRATSSRSGAAASPLTGRIEDADGNPMSPSFAYGKSGRLYRYYVSAPLQRGGKPQVGDPHPRRVPAQLIEATLARAISDHAGSCTSPLARIQRVRVLADRLVVTLTSEDDASPGRLTIPFRIATAKQRNDITKGSGEGPRRDPVLIRALRKAHAQLERDATGKPIIHAAPDLIRARRVLRLAFLAPDLQRAILEGRQPPDLTLAYLLGSEIPLLWSEQRKLLGPLT